MINTLIMSSAGLKSQLLTSKIQLSLNKQYSRLIISKKAIWTIYFQVETLWRIGSLERVKLSTDCCSWSYLEGEKERSRLGCEAAWGCSIWLSYLQIQIHHSELQLASMCHKFMGFRKERLVCGEKYNKSWRFMSVSS